MPEIPKPDFLEILRILTRHRVEFIVVGGVCAVLNGVPMNTFDLDLVHARNPENLPRVRSALAQLDAHYRTHPDEKRRPTPAHLASSGHQLLLTCFGPLDLLGTIGAGHDYEALRPHTTEMDLGDDLSVRVLTLDKLIQVKEEVGDEKDRAVLPLLRRTLEEKSRR